MKRSLALSAWWPVLLFTLGFLFNPAAEAQQLAWQTLAPSSQAFYVTPDATVFVVDGNGVLRSISSTGQVNWQLNLGSMAITRLVPSGNGDVVLTTQDSKVIAVATNGQIHWQATLPAVATGPPAVGPDNTVYVAADTKLFAYDASGSLKWTFDDQNALTGQVAVGPSGIAVGAAEGGLYLVDASGKQLFHYAVGESISIHPTVATGGIASFLSSLNEVEGVTTAGEQAWFVTPDNPDGKYIAGLETEHNGTLYLVEDSHLIRALSPDGKFAWTFDVVANVASPLVLTPDNHLIVGTDDKRILTVDAATGLKSGEANIGSVPHGVGIASGGRYFALIGGTAVTGGGADLLAAYVPTDTTPPLWVRTGLADTTLLALARSPSNPDTFVTTGDKMVAISTDGGKTWASHPVDVPSGDSTTLNFAAIASDNSVYVTSQKFLFNSPAGASNFSVTATMDDVGAVAVDPKDPAHIYLVNAIDTQALDSKQKGDNASPVETPVIFSDLLWAGNGTLYATSKDGLYKRVVSDWAKAADGRTTHLAATADGTVIYAGSDGQLLRSGDSGATFAPVGANQLLGTVFSVAVNPTNGAEVMAGTVISADTFDNASIKGINLYYSKDSGANWQILDKGLSEVSPHALSGGSGYFLMASNTGVWRIETSGGGVTPTVIPGDINGDGKVNVSDATLALQAAVGLANLTATQMKAADVSPPGAPDGKINVSDATRILRAAVGLENL